MKKILAGVLTAIMVLGFAACSSQANYTDFKVLSEDFGAEEYGVGMRKDEVALYTEIQKHLDAMIKDGTAAEISKKWFGEDIMLKDSKPAADYTLTSDDESLSYITNKGTLILGLDDNFPPMGFRDENNEIVGFDVDLAKEVAKRMGVELKLQPIDWDSKEMELSGKNIDVIWNGLTITPERIEAMCFSNPYIANKQIIVVPESSKIATKADLEGKKVGVQKGSSAVDAINKDEATASIIGELVEYPDNVSAYMDLKTGRIDALVGDEIALRYMLENE